MTEKLPSDPEGPRDLIMFRIVDLGLMAIGDLPMDVSMAELKEERRILRQYLSLEQMIEVHGRLARSHRELSGPFVGQ